MTENLEKYIVSKEDWKELCQQAGAVHFLKDHDRLHAVYALSSDKSRLHGVWFEDRTESKIFPRSLRFDIRNRKLVK